MDKTDWLDKSIEERLQWYKSEIDRLKASFDDELEGDKTRTELLQEIKKRIIFDGTPSEERMKEGSQREKKYYKVVYKTYKALPNIHTEKDKWDGMLEKARGILANI